MVQGAGCRVQGVGVTWMFSTEGRAMEALTAGRETEEAPSPRRGAVLLVGASLSEACCWVQGLGLKVQGAGVSGYGFWGIVFLSCFRSLGIRERENASERESERARERGRAREQESERARESEGARERERERARERDVDTNTAAMYAPPPRHFTAPLASGYRGP